MSEAGSLSDRIRAEMADTLDEELELELDDVRLDGQERASTRRPRALLQRSCSGCRASWSSCRTGWSAQKLKVVVLFEGATPPARAA